METAITPGPAEAFYKYWGGEKKKNMPGEFQIVSLTSV